MEPKKRMAELIVETGSFEDLDKPVILASYELGIYYVHTEKLVQDQGKFEQFGDDSVAMINHAVEMMDKQPKFREVIEILAKEIQPVIEERDFTQISGGQRRDWLFSGPVARVLELPHISLYKKLGDNNFEVLNPDGFKIPTKYTFGLGDIQAIHIVDMLTEASSCCKKPNGWIPQLRTGGAEIRDLFAITTRLQGGEQNLEKIGVKAHTFVEIGPEFLAKYSKNPEQAIAYQKNPRVWSANYLRNHGALDLIETFNPDGKKLERARGFLMRYGKVLEEAGKIAELEQAIKSKYSIGLEFFV